MKIILLPGMGADSTMYGGPWKDLRDAVFADWPTYRGEKTLSEVADRLISEYKIDSSDFVAGSSLGGMVALEIAAKLDNKATFLIGSAKSKEEINPFLRLLAPLAKVTPIRFAQILCGSSGGHLTGMFSNADAGFIKAMCLALSKWEAPGVPADHVIRIHGTRDRIIKCPETCFEIQDAGHLLAISHTDETLSCLEQSIRKLRVVK